MQGRPSILPLVPGKLASMLTFLDGGEVDFFLFFVRGNSAATVDAFFGVVAFGVVRARSCVFHSQHQQFGDGNLDLWKEFLLDQCD